ncbi:prenylcysteine oxidoreductase [Niveomyces insectorum RCEF 264]|uniref:Prenylcysteine oxidoreductase n=1 Tax=Niveomyces insectorum RCEF 264 TaxID=1081102 RepID=A0A162J8H2_9HYPO|nr:prenylcysteine oxidoreductase [Niveomyces insectorum RCEF 264]
MRFTHALWTTGLLLSGRGAKAAADSSPNVRQIAIIGAGAAGASTAYHLRQFADDDGVALNITLFETTDHIGGRTRTVNVYGDPAQPVELGASIFVEINHILWNATQRFDLPLQSPGFDGLLGVWDGERFVYTQDDSSANWWNLVKLFWKYGTAPYRANKLMHATVDRFLNLYNAPYFPFRSLTSRAYELELTYVTGQTGQQFLEQNKVAGPFSHDIIQASTRVNYASNLVKIHGLDTMVALAPEGASQVTGGNWQIFHNMVHASHAAFCANTSVTNIARVSGTDPSTPKYVLQTKSTTPAGGAEQRDTKSSDDDGELLRFDDVVIATPFQFSGIDVADGVLEGAIDAIPYVKLHVTLFTSPKPLSAAFFRLPPDARVPTTVLTTLAPGDNPSSGAQGAGSAGFFSISTLASVVHPDTQNKEYLYKIFSPDKVTAAFLSALLGADVPDDVTGGPTARAAEADEHDGPTEGTASDSVISWYYPHVFHSYPRALPRVTFQDPVLGDGIYYTSGIESFISTMETSALMGRNVARLIVDDMQGLTTGGDVVIPPSAEKMTSKETEDVMGEL